MPRAWHVHANYWWDSLVRHALQEVASMPRAWHVHALLWNNACRMHLDRLRTRIGRVPIVDYSYLCQRNGCVASLRTPRTSSNSSKMLETRFVQPTFNKRPSSHSDTSWSLCMGLHASRSLPNDVNPVSTIFRCYLCLLSLHGIVNPYNVYSNQQQSFSSVQSKFAQYILHLHNKILPPINYNHLPICTIQNVSLIQHRST